MLLLSVRGNPCKMPFFPARGIPLPLALPVLDTTVARRAPTRRGKVRDIYDFGDRLLIVATDRISAFDYVLASGIPDKGKVLTQISAFWFARTAGIVANHLLSTEPREYPEEALADAGTLAGRSMLVRRTDPLPIECVARGYLSGSGWKDYVATGEVCPKAVPPNQAMFASYGCVAQKPWVRVAP